MDPKGKKNSNEISVPIANKQGYKFTHLPFLFPQSFIFTPVEVWKKEAVWVVQVSLWFSCVLGHETERASWNDQRWHLNLLIRIETWGVWPHIKLVHLAGKEYAKPFRLELFSVVNFVPTVPILQLFTLQVAVTTEDSERSGGKSTVRTRQGWRTSTSMLLSNPKTRRRIV